MELTQELVKEVFEYKAGKIYWKKPGSRRTVGKEAGTIQKYKSGHNRMRVGLLDRKIISARIIFLYHHGYLPETVDHRDRDTLNDDIDNLRPASQAQNTRNRKSNRGSSSEYIGVSLNGKRWAAMIRTKFIGNFDTQEEAALAYNNEAEILYGDFANLNVIHK